MVQNPVTGNELTENFTGTVSFDQVKVSGFTVPATLPAGKTAKVTVNVTNQGTAPMILQTDARLDGQQLVQLSPQFAGSTLKLPQSVDDLSQLPAYLVPPDTSTMSLSASTTVPAQVELNSPLGGIDLFGDLPRRRAAAPSRPQRSRSPRARSAWASGARTCRRSGRTVTAAHPPRRRSCRPPR